jgi:ParB-like chromosome segregation protein Spo0J
MKHHPIADVWPMMAEDKLHQLADDIRKNGQLVPVWLYEGKILDGRNRWAACKIAGVEPKTRDYTGEEPTAFAVAMNDRRRHMNKGALAAVAAELEPFFAADAKRRQRDSIKARDDKGRASPVVEKVPQLEQPSRPPKAREEAAKSVGVNDRYVSDAKKVKQEAPEVFERLKAGKITLQDAKREVAKKPTDDWREDERSRQAQVESGLTVVANASADKNLIAWAERERLAVRIDRSTRYGNPFVLDEDGDRDEVCDAYERHYLPHKPSITDRIEARELSGKVLVCHCFPKRCHGDCLAIEANSFLVH